MYYLYLRPFTATNKFRISPAQRPPIQDSLKPTPTRTLEALIARALSTHGISLVALGKPGEAIGAGRVATTDDEWKKLFEKLAISSSGFIVVPSRSSGTLWEVQWLIEHKLLDNTVFVLPNSALFKLDEAMVAEYRAIGIQFPSHARGKLLKCNNDGQVIAAVDTAILTRPGAGSVIQDLKLLQQPAPSQSPQ
jgi:hypothetical protein